MCARPAWRFDRDGAALPDPAECAIDTHGCRLAAANNATAATNLQAREETGASHAANSTGPFRRRPADRRADRAGALRRLVGHAAAQSDRSDLQPIRSADAHRRAARRRWMRWWNCPCRTFRASRRTRTSRSCRGGAAHHHLGFDHFRDELVYSDVRGRNPLRDVRVRQRSTGRSTWRRCGGPSCAAMPGSPARWRALPERAPTDINTRTFL